MLAMSLVAAWAWLGVGASQAEAHLVTTGLGPTYDGIVHLLLSPIYLLAIAGLALLAGLRGTAHARLALFVLPSAWLVGGLVGLVTGAQVPQLVIAAVLLVLGSLAAADLELPSWTTGMVAVVVGLPLGVDTSFGAAGSGFGNLAGAIPCVFVLEAIALAGVLRARGWFGDIPPRVAGSWIAATGLLVAGWALRGSFIS